MTTDEKLLASIQLHKDTALMLRALWHSMTPFTEEFEKALLAEAAFFEECAAKQEATWAARAHECFIAPEETDEGL